MNNESFYAESDDLVTKRNPRVIDFFNSIERIQSNLEQVAERNKPSLNGERYLTDKELSECLKIGRRTLQEWRNNGQINYVHLGGKILYRESDVQAMLEKNYRKAWI